MAAYEAALAMMVPPPVFAANRAPLMVSDGASIKPGTQHTQLAGCRNACEPIKAGHRPPSAATTS